MDIFFIWYVDKSIISNNDNKIDRFIDFFLRFAFKAIKFLLLLLPLCLDIFMFFFADCYSMAVLADWSSKKRGRKKFNIKILKSFPEFFLIIISLVQMEKLSKQKIIPLFLTFHTHPHRHPSHTKFVNTLEKFKILYSEKSLLFVQFTFY